MDDQISILLAILSMALVTLGCRWMGYLVFIQTSPNPFFKRALAHLPGCIFAAYVLPALIAGPTGNWFAAGVTTIAMAKTRNLGISIGAGVATAYLARFVGFGH